MTDDYPWNERPGYDQEQPPSGEFDYGQLLITGYDELDADYSLPPGPRRQPWRPPLSVVLGTVAMVLVAILAFIKFGSHASPTVPASQFQYTGASSSAPVAPTFSGAEREGAEPPGSEAREHKGKASRKHHGAASTADPENDKGSG